jgi:hypothetical protein
MASADSRDDAKPHAGERLGRSRHVTVSETKLWPPGPWPGSDSGRVRFGQSEAALEGRRYSHSIVAGGLLLRSSATRFTPGISLMIRLEIVSNRS